MSGGRLAGVWRLLAPLEVEFDKPEPIIRGDPCKEYVVVVDVFLISTVL